MWLRVYAIFNTITITLYLVGKNSRFQKKSNVFLHNKNTSPKNARKSWNEQKKTCYKQGTKRRLTTNFPPEIMDYQKVFPSYWNQAMVLGNDLIFPAYSKLHLTSFSFLWLINLLFYLLLQTQFSPILMLKGGKRWMKSGTLILWNVTGDGVKRCYKTMSHV